MKHIRLTVWLILILALWAAPAAAQRMAVTAAVANIRSGPGTRYEVLWQVERYYPFEQIGKKGAWVKFRDFEGDQGWIHTSLIGKTPTVITNANRCNVRSGPGKKNPVVFPVDKGVPFKLLGKKGSWLHIQHADGDQGWIHKSLVW